MDDKRAERLHFDSLVVDTLGPDGPWLMTPEAEVRLKEMIEDRNSPSEVLLEIDRVVNDALLSGKLLEFWEGWEQSGVDVVSSTIGGFGETPFSYENAIRDVSRWNRRFDQLPRYKKVVSAESARQAQAEGRRGVILNFQNTLHLGTDLGNLDLFYDLGVRIIQLTYNERNLVGDGCTEREPSGLSRFGQQMVRRMNELGIVVDVSHCSEPTSFDAIEASEKPIAVTHAFCRALSDHDRGKSDDLIKALGASGGYFGVLLVPFFLTPHPNPSLNHFMEHFDHVVELIGADKVGVGSDWGQVLPNPLVELMNEEIRRFGFRDEHRVDFGATMHGYRRWEDWPNVTKAFVDAGYSDDQIRGFLGENFLRLFDSALS